MESDDESTLKNSNEKDNDLTAGAQNGDDFYVDDLFALLDGLPMDDFSDTEWFSNHILDQPVSAPTKKPEFPPHPVKTRSKRRARTGVSVWPLGSPSLTDPSSSSTTSDSCFKTPTHPVKTRSKRRARTGVSVWSLGYSSSSSTTSSSSSSSAPSSPLRLSGAKFLDEPMVERQKKKKTNLSSVEVLRNGGQTQTRRCSHCGVQKSPQWREGPRGSAMLCNACGIRYKSVTLRLSGMVERQKKKKKNLPSVEISRNGGQTQTPPCSHCGVQKSPQWREGPRGPKTLCNACGIRYKSGRLLPEYRPACSPTFSSELHSNYHRKVIDIGREKNTSDDADETG